MPYCPSCRATVESDSSSCESCGALFSSDGLQPIERHPPRKWSVAGAIAKLGLASVLLPGAAFLVGLVLWGIIPGCKCDEGAGCSGCGVNGLVESLLFGGFVASMGALITVLPASLLVAALVAVVTGRKSKWGEHV
jgi:hypothetical protein